MPKVDESIDVRVPVEQAYNQWTQFEEFPKFMEGIQSVKQLIESRGEESGAWRGEVQDGNTQ